jgi:hypothetical protein
VKESTIERDDLEKKKGPSQLASPNNRSESRQNESFVGSQALDSIDVNAEISGGKKKHHGECQSCLELRKEMVSREKDMHERLIELQG